LRQAIGDAGFAIEDERIFGQNPHGPCMVAREESAATNPQS
jgi:hypothetical protein